MVSYRESFPAPGAGSSSFGRAVGSFVPDEGVSRTGRRGSPPGGGQPSQPAFSKVVRLCSQRERSASEVAQRLSKEGYADVDARAAIDRAIGCGLIDDERFAESFIRGRLSAGKGSRSIATDLKRRYGIADDIVNRLLGGESFADAAQTERAIAFLDAHPPRAKDAWGSAYRKLVARGYPAAVCSSAVRKWMEGSR
ncbi:regulatory protein RecX [Curtanaerobium respiraculi]|jgi:regulatory protein|uniref:regulatory protein RecX n=1 Tax=Curtanaerobium respiraculi TaxID=2949669 RepID=UPI0024B3856A|nr:regulatory protein RecX [Curtanaerobium respiraculi]